MNEAGYNPYSAQRQLLTTGILDLLHRRLPGDALCVVGVTMEDLYPDPSWNFVFGQASLTDRVGVRKERSRHRFVDHGDQRRRVAIELAQRAAATDPQAEHVEVSRADDLEVRDGPLRALDDGMGCNLDERACRRALHFGTHSSVSVKSMLDKNLEAQPLEQELPLPSPVHENLRGGPYYH